MPRCEAENREIQDGEVAYVVSHPGVPRLYFIGERGLEKYIPRTFWARDIVCGVAGSRPGLNFHVSLPTACGEPTKGEFAFSVGFWELRNFPGLYTLFFIW